MIEYIKDSKLITIIEGFNYIDFDYDDMSNIYDLEEIIKESISNVDLKYQNECLESRLYSMEFYRDMYYIVLKEEKIIGFLTYSNMRLQKSIVIKEVFFVEEYYDFSNIVSLMNSFMKNKKVESLAKLMEPKYAYDLVSVGFRKSSLVFNDELYVYFYDDKMDIILDKIDSKDEYSNDMDGVYYFEYLKKLQRNHFISSIILTMLSVGPTFIILYELAQLLFELNEENPFSLIVNLLFFSLFTISLIFHIRLRKYAREELNFNLHMKDFTVKADYNKMFF